MNDKATYLQILRLYLQPKIEKGHSVSRKIEYTTQKKYE